MGSGRVLSTLIKIPESRFLFGPVGPANLSFSVRSVHRGDTLVRSVRSVAYISEFGRSGPTVVEIRSGGPTGPVPPLDGNQKVAVSATRTCSQYFFQESWAAQLRARGERVHLVGREQIGLWYCIALEIVVVVLETVYGPLYVS